VPRLGGREDPELRHVGGADDDEAGLAQAPHQVGAVGGAVALEELRGEVHAQALDRDVGLDRDRHARERALVARLDLVRRGERALAVDLDERVQVPVERPDPVQAGLHQLARRQLAAADAGRQVACRREHEIARGHGQRAEPTRERPRSVPPVQIAKGPSAHE
jgi:hypothetical protein